MTLAAACVALALSSASAASGSVSPRVADDAPFALPDADLLERQLAALPSPLLQPWTIATLTLFVAAVVILRRLARRRT